jgi:hypothetical protein
MSPCNWIRRRFISSYYVLNKTTKLNQYKCILTLSDNPLGKQYLRRNLTSGAAQYPKKNRTKKYLRLSLPSTYALTSDVREGPTIPNATETLVGTCMVESPGGSFEEDDCQSWEEN